MMTLKVNDREYNIKYGVEATSKSKIFPKMARLEDSMSSGEFDLDKFDDLALTIVEVLLVGLQNKHKDEFGYDLNTGEGKDEAFSKACELLDDYSDNGDDIMELYGQLTEEMMKNGFLRSLFQTVQKEIAEEQAAEKKTATETETAE